MYNIGASLCLIEVNGIIASLLINEKITCENEVKIAHQRLFDNAETFFVLQGEIELLKKTIDIISKQIKDVGEILCCHFLPKPVFDIEILLSPKNEIPEKAIGLVEFKSLTSAILCADAMLKNSNIEIVEFAFYGSKSVVVKIIGNENSIYFAFEAAIEKAAINQFEIKKHLLPLEKKFKLNTSNNFKNEKMNYSLFDQIEENISKPIKALNEVINSDLNKMDYFASNEILQAAKNENMNLDLLQKLNVHDLRKLARGIKNFPIKGRDISMANKNELINCFTNL